MYDKARDDGMYAYCVNVRKTKLRMESPESVSIGTALKWAHSSYLEGSNEENAV